MVLKLYLTYMSQPCRAIAIFLRMHGVPFEEKIVSFVTGDTQSEWFAKINPMQRVPVLDDDGFVLTESVAILHYLSVKVGAADHWYPADTLRRARADEFIAWQHTGVRRHAALVFIVQALRPYKTGQPTDKTALISAAQDLEKILNQMENYFLKDSPFLAGNEPSLADLLGICELMQAASVGYPLTRDRPRLGDWMVRIKNFLQPHFDETHKEIMEFSSKYISEFKL